MKILTKKYRLYAACNDFFFMQLSNSRIDVMLKNITNDPVLFMGYIGIDLTRLQDCDFQIKKDFVNAIKALVDEYSVREPKEKIQELI